ncbi:MAG: serpin family protein [Candidatus Obscuribacterales bacterium]|jgi:hypothetical protein|nr:serpin family protein [Candidatus Obscuribacterales bacterium]
MAEKAATADVQEKKNEVESSNRPANPFDSNDLQTGRVARTQDAQADKILNMAGDQKGTMTPDQMAGSITEGKQVLDQMAKAAGKAPGQAGWDEFVKGLKNNPLDNADRNDKMVKAVQAAYKNGGVDGVEKLIKEANDKIVGPFGPTIQLNDNGTATLTLKHQTKDQKLHDIAKPLTFKLETNDKPDNNGELRKDVNPAPIASGYGLTKAFQELSKLAPGEWTPKSDTQKKAKDFADQNKDDLEKISSKMLDGLASKDVNELNKFLKDKGYDIRLNPLGKDGVGVVTSIEIEGKWMAKNYAPIKSGDKEYPAFQKKTDDIHVVAGHNEPVVKLFDQDGIKVFISPYEGDLNGLEATAVAKKLTPDANNPSIKNPDGYTHVVVPKVDMNRVSELDWLKGMTNSEGHRIDQALAQAMVQMDEKGFKAKEGLAIATTRSINMEKEKNLTINKDFIFFVVKEGVSQPIFATKIDQKYWKAPAKN